MIRGILRSGLLRPATVLDRGVMTRMQTSRLLSSLPSHQVVPMPALSPTMEVGTIVKWNLNEGDKFSPGSSFCDVETDKATMSFDATEEGYIAKILQKSGEIKIGQPLLVTVDDAADVAAFANYAVTASSGASAPAPKAPAAAPVAAAPAQKAAAAPVAAPAASSAGRVSDRIFASPLAKKLTKEAGHNLNVVASAIGGHGSGPNARIVAADVHRALQALANQPAAAPAAPKAAHAAPAAAAAPRVSSGAAFEDFVVPHEHMELAERLSHAKKTIPHYYVSVELNLKTLVTLRDTLNAMQQSGKKKDDSIPAVSVLDLLVKAAAASMKTVPSLNASWMDSFVRQYDQVDINVVMSSGNPAAGRTSVLPVLRDVNALGLGTISARLASYEQRVAEGQALSETEAAEGTFTIHNLGAFGVKAAAPIILPPQAAALSLGSIIDTVVPRETAEGDNWEVAPVMVATLVCDHRVVDGAVAAQWLQAFKQQVEQPMNLLM